MAILHVASQYTKTYQTLNRLSMDQTCASKGRLTEKHWCTKNYLSDKITTSKMSKVVFVFNFLLFTSKRNSTVATFEHKHIP